MRKAPCLCPLPDGRRCAECAACHPSWEQQKVAIELDKLEQRYRKAAEAADRSRGLRDATIIRAIATGLTHQQISDATGLTRGRIGQIAQRKEP